MQDNNSRRARERAVLDAIEQASDALLDETAAALHANFPGYTGVGSVSRATDRAHAHSNRRGHLRARGARERDRDGR